MQIEAGTNPFTLFDSWFKEAVEAEINDPDAIALASVNADGMPSVRMVLLRQWSDEGFFFFTNYESRKAGELIATGKAAFCLHWKSQSRPLESREALAKAVAEVEERFPDDVPRPPHWGGFMIVPQEIEFWADGEHRLHDRFRFTPDGKGGWDIQRLNP